EVAPKLFVLAPLFEETNLANDHNLLVMTLMSEVARRHNFRVLFHEKPFSGINGSGKHNNWSLGTDCGDMLFSPGKTPDDNLRFLTFTVNVMAAVHRHNALLKASIMSATNAHRLGANEAPPAIISIFLGSQLSDVFNKLENATPEQLSDLSAKSGHSLGLAQIPELLLDNTDRNRTSPFAFTGNRFEFRAVGSSANCASAMIALNAAVADQLASFHNTIQKRIKGGENLKDALLDEIRALYKESKAIVFDGNGYSDEWRQEAESRGLDCETSAPKIFDAYLRPESEAMFGRTGVFSPVELQARNEVKWEMYTKKIQIEARVLGDLAINHIIPVATRYQSLLVDNVVKLKDLFPGVKGAKVVSHDLDTIEKISHHMDIIKTETDRMIDARKAANAIDDEREKAIAYHDNVVPPMEIIRRHIDKLELMVDNEMWPLPKYRELLFIR
ncbi:MAG: glutamine synthetase type III, partial [Muribaculaceae bacterium]|nr:glutamine synthetase type III [Muribaculaceae bacterium]